MSSNRGHRAGQCAPEVPRTRIRARGDLQERRTRPGGSLIRRRYGGGVGNRSDGPKDLRLSEQMQSMETFPAESGTLPRGTWCWVASARHQAPRRCCRNGSAEAVLQKWGCRGVSGRYSWALISRDAPSGVMMVCPASGAQRWPMMS